MFSVQGEVVFLACFDKDVAKQVTGVLSGLQCKIPFLSPRTAASEASNGKLTTVKMAEIKRQD